MAISSGFSYFVFDFAGSGLSDGRYISLGWFEVSDVESVLNFIDKNINSKAKIILWGRSMGAVTGNSIHICSFTVPCKV
jgi:alpha/beta superfamily hydrolase